MGGVLKAHGDGAPLMAGNLVSAVRWVFMFADARNLKVSHITKCEGCRSAEPNLISAHCKNIYGKTK